MSCNGIICLVDNQRDDEEITMHLTSANTDHFLVKLHVINAIKCVIFVYLKRPFGKICGINTESGFKGFHDHSD